MGLSSQLSHSPAQNSHICSDTAFAQQKERIWIFSIPSLLFLLKIQAIWSKQGHIWFFQDHFNSFQDHCLNCYKSNILASISFRSTQKKAQLLKFKISNTIVSIVSIVHLYEQIWQSVKNTQNLK